MSSPPPVQAPCVSAGDGSCHTHPGGWMIACDAARPVRAEAGAHAYGEGTCEWSGQEHCDYPHDACKLAPPTPTPSAVRAGEIEQLLGNINGALNEPMEEDDRRRVAKVLHAALATAEAAGWRAGRDAAARLPRYNCDCLPAGPDGQPCDDPDIAIYAERDVILASDLELLPDIPPALTPLGAAEGERDGGEMPTTIEVCTRPFNDGICLGVIYRPQPEVIVCGRCGGSEPGVVYTRAGTQNAVA